MNILDIRTVLFSSIVTSGLCAVVMNSLWRQNRRRSPELAYWQADFILQFAAILLIALRGILPDVVSMSFGVPSILLGALLMLLGLERYTGKTSPQRYNFILLAVFTLVHEYFIYAQPSLPARNINQSLGLLVFCGQCAWLLLRRADSEMRPYTRMVGLIFIAYGLVSLVRIFVDLVMPHTNDLFKSGLYDTLAILIYQMLFIGLTFALFLMVNRRLFTELERDIAERKMAEAALKISQEKFSVAFQNTPDALVITSLPDGKMIEVNESFFRMSGFSKTESLGRTTVDLNLWGDIVHRDQMVTALQQQHRVLDVETDFRKKSGQLFRGSISSELIQLQGQTCVLNVIRDVTERRQAEETIRSLARFPAENPNPVLRITQDGKLLYANQAAFAQLRDWKLEQGAPAPAALQDSIRAVFETQATRTIEIPCGNCTFSIAISPAIENEYVNLYGLDVTDRKWAEEALRKSGAQLRAILDATPFPIALVDVQDNNIEFWSHSALTLFGQTAPTTAEWSQLAYPDPDYRREVVERWKPALEKARQSAQAVNTGEYRVTCRDGSVRICELYAAFLGERLVVTFNDITERKQAEEQVKSQMDDLRRWQDVTLGREERVQELKREVNELCRRAGAAVRYPSQETSHADAGIVEKKP